jgi:hypothetical protein
MAKLRTAAVVLSATLAMTGSMLTASTASAVPASAATCSPKLDIEGVIQNPDGGYPLDGWTNTCGVGVDWEEWSGSATWGCPYLYAVDIYQGCMYNAFVITIRSPYTPYHRIWFHQDVDGAGWAVCFYSENTDISIPDQYSAPGNIQVSANTSPC